MNLRDQNTMEEIRRLALRMMALSEGRPSGKGAVEHERYSPGQLASFAKQIHSARRRRDEFLPIERGEPSWDMLLDLFVNHVLGRRVSVTSATVMSGCPHTTALRHLVKLEEQGLLFRQDSGKDQRVSYVSLSKAGYEKMKILLEQQLSIFYSEAPTDPFGTFPQGDSGAYLIRNNVSSISHGKKRSPAG